MARKRWRWKEVKEVEEEVEREEGRGGRMERYERKLGGREENEEKTFVFWSDQCDLGKLTSDFGLI